MESELRVPALGVTCTGGRADLPPSGQITAAAAAAARGYLLPTCVAPRRANKNKPPQGRDTLQLPLTQEV